MKKIRYLLALSNIKPTGAQRAKMATAFLRGAEKKEQRAGMKNAIGAVKRVFIILVAAAAVFGAVFAAYKIATAGHEPKDEITTEKQHADPADTNEADLTINRDFNTWIAPMYQNDGVYDLFRYVMSHTGAVYGESGEHTGVWIDGYADELLSKFNAAGRDLDNVMMSLFAFAEPGNITRYDNKSEYEKTEIILASRRVGTFEYIVSFPAIVHDGAIYLDISSLYHMSDMQADGYKHHELKDGDYLEGFFAKAGYVYARSDDGAESYMIDPNMLLRANVTKIRVEGGLPVTYAKYNMRIKFDKATSPYETSDLTVYEKTATVGKETVYTVDRIESYGADLYTTAYKTASAISSASPQVTASARIQYFPSPPQELRCEICNTINKTGCDWFLYLYTEESSASPVGVAMYYNADGEIIDQAANVFTAHYDPYLNVFPTFDLNQTDFMPKIVKFDGTGFVPAETDFSVPPSDVLDEYKNKCLPYFENIKYYTFGTGTAIESCFSVDLQGYGGEIYLKNSVYEKLSKLLDFLGIGYTERYTGQAGVEKFKDESGSIDYFLSPVYGSDTASQTGPLMQISYPFQLDLAVTKTGERRTIKSKRGGEYSLDTLYGYRLTQSGFITDLDNVIIGACNKNGRFTVFRDPSAPLYVISDEKGLLYIGNELPEGEDTLYPFESCMLMAGPKTYVSFRFGYLGYFLGPYPIITNFVLEDRGSKTVLTVYAKDPEYATYSFSEYDEEAQTYNKVTLGKYGDRFIQTCGGYACRVKHKSGTSGRSKPIIEISYNNG